MATEAMIEAFVADERERSRWLFTLREVREAVGCPCTTTTHVQPRLCGPSTGFEWIDDETFVPGRPVSNCALCRGVGVSVAPPRELRSKEDYGARRTDAPVPRPN